MESICRDLASRGWPALHLAGSMPQTERLAAVAALQNQRCRVLLSTDLASRGVDAEQVCLLLHLCHFPEEGLKIYLSELGGGAEAAPYWPKREGSVTFVSANIFIVRLANWLHYTLAVA